MYLIIDMQTKPKVVAAFEQKDPAIVMFLNLMNGNTMFDDDAEDINQFKECLKKLNDKHYVSGGDFALQAF